ncbi:hypothetical protein [Microvirga lenta]|uniref:hypothetical protein n=1 Tax=Microvirga lenta TaxID=2881337 RepID=UPI001CFFB80B|nr:hypothetical protein [Microvirga lenta]MCB5176787.1 hypothetical protein [Microvirga lenta]
MAEQARLADLIRQKHATSAVAVNDNVHAYGRLSMALSQMSPMLAQVGLGGSVGMIGGGAFAGIAAGVASVIAAGTGIARAGDQWTAYANRLIAAGEASQMVGARQA